MIAILFFAIFAYFPWQDTSAQRKDAWEYTTINEPNSLLTQPKLQSDLNNLGKDGWELVAVQPGSAQLEESILILKRKK